MCSEIVWPCSVPISLFCLKYTPLLLCELIIWCRTTTDDFLLIRNRISDACYDASELSLFSANRAHWMNSKTFFKSRRGKWSPDLNKMLLWGKAPNLLMATFHWNLSKLWHFSRLSKCWYMQPHCKSHLFSLGTENILSIWLMVT